MAAVSFVGSFDDSSTTTTNVSGEIVVVVVVVDASRGGPRASNGLRGLSNGLRVVATGGGGGAGVVEEGFTSLLLSAAALGVLVKLLVKCLLDSSDWKRSNSSMLLSAASGIAAGLFSSWGV